MLRLENIKKPLQFIVHLHDVPGCIKPDFADDPVAVSGIYARSGPTQMTKISKSWRMYKLTV